MGWEGSQMVNQNLLTWEQKLALVECKTSTSITSTIWGRIYLIFFDNSELFLAEPGGLGGFTNGKSKPAN